MSTLLAALVLAAVAVGLIALFGALAYGGGRGVVLLWPSRDEEES